jgi:hypothetical protein
VTETKASFEELCASLEATRATARELRAAGAAIRMRLSATRQSYLEALDRARTIQDEVRKHLASLRAPTAEQSSLSPSNAVLQALAVLGRDESHLDEMTDDLIAAYQTATAVGNDELQGLLAGALKLIGRHLATQVGPKAANVIMN